MKGDPSSFPIPRQLPPGAVPDAAGFPRLPVASLSSNSFCGPLPEAMLFWANVTGSGIDMTHDARGRLCLIGRTHGRESFPMILRYGDGA